MRNPQDDSALAYLGGRGYLVFSIAAARASPALLGVSPSFSFIFFAGGKDLACGGIWDCDLPLRSAGGAEYFLFGITRCGGFFAESTAASTIRPESLV